jgi:hypothetical protein
MMNEPVIKISQAESVTNGETASTLKSHYMKRTRMVPNKNDKVMEVQD